MITIFKLSGLRLGVMVKWPKFQNYHGQMVKIGQFPGFCGHGQHLPTPPPQLNEVCTNENARKCVTHHFQHKFIKLGGGGVR